MFRVKVRRRVRFRLKVRFMVGVWFGVRFKNFRSQKLGFENFRF